MTLKLTALTAAIALCGGIACSSNTGSPVSPSAATVVANEVTADARRSAEPSIVDIASSNPNFSTLVAAVMKAGLVGTLNGTRHYTVFAPTNDAFNAAAVVLNTALNLKLVDGEGNGLGDELVDALPASALAPVLLYHVTNGDRNSTSVLAAGKVQMLDGNTATVANGQIGGAAFSSLLDLRARNGIVHVLNGVMVPPGLLP